MEWSSRRQREASVLDGCVQAELSCIPPHEFLDGTGSHTYQAANKCAVDIAAGVALFELCEGNMLRPTPDRGRCSPPFRARSFHATKLKKDPSDNFACCANFSMIASIHRSPGRLTTFFTHISTREQDLRARIVRAVNPDNSAATGVFSISRNEVSRTCHGCGSFPKEFCRIFCRILGF